MGLGYVVGVTGTLKYGGYLHSLYALLLVPVIHRVGKVQYFNGMCLAAIWKYFLVGGFVAIGLAVNANSVFGSSNILGIQAILLIILTIIVLIYLLSRSKS